MLDWCTYKNLKMCAIPPRIFKGYHLLAQFLLKCAMLFTAQCGLELTNQEKISNFVVFIVKRNDKHQDFNELSS